MHMNMYIYMYRITIQYIEYDFGKLKHKVRKLWGCREKESLHGWSFYPFLPLLEEKEDLRQDGLRRLWQSF